MIVSARGGNGMAKKNLALFGPIMISVSLLSFVFAGNGSLGGRGFKPIFFKESDRISIKWDKPAAVKSGESLVLEISSRRRKG